MPDLPTWFVRSKRERRQPGDRKCDGDCGNHALTLRLHGGKKSLR
jgi:hypothetical protein